MVNYGTDMPPDVSDLLRPTDSGTVVVLRTEDTKTDSPRLLCLNAGPRFDGCQSLDACPMAESKSGGPRRSTRSKDGWRATEGATVAFRRGPPSCLRKHGQDFCQVDRGLGQSHARRASTQE
jgi:hypothetical protein